MGTSPAQLLNRARRFLLQELWQADFGPRGLWSLLLSTLQLAALIGRGFVGDQLLLRASALTYMTSLAIIPILVVVLSIINWLGLSRDLVVVGVNLQEPSDQVQSFAEEFGMAFPIVIDRGGGVADVWRLGGPVGGIPTSYFIDESGVIQDFFYGPMTEKSLQERVAKILPEEAG